MRSVKRFIGRLSRRSVSWEGSKKGEGIVGVLEPREGGTPKRRATWEKVGDGRASFPM